MRSTLSLGTALLTALTLSTLAPLARADLAPPAGFVESCTLERQRGAGKECFDCQAYHGNHAHCSESLADYGFAQSCRSSGASVWSEVWCRAASPAAKPVPKDVIAQLGNASSHPPSPSSAAPIAPLPTGAAPTAPVDPPSIPSIPSSPEAPAPVPPPPGGCGGCSAPGPETAIWAPMLALGALAIGWSRRRARR